jgi:tetratricopeptide (TPR) repeat protein
MQRKASGSVLILIFLCLSALGQGDSWDAHTQAGKDAMAKQQYSEAEESFRKALVAAEKFGEKDARFSGTLLFLAQACDAQSKRDEAEGLARRATEAMEKALRAYPTKQIEQQLLQADAASSLFDKTADIFSSHQKYPEAEMLYKRVVQIRESVAQENPKPKNNEDFLRFMGQALSDTQGKLAAANEKLGNLYFTERKFPEAAATYEKAQKIRETDTRTDKRVLAQTLTNLATSYAAQDKYTQAEPLYQSALKLFEEANWAEKPETASTMQLYALLLKKTGREEEANAMLEKVSTIRKKLGQMPQ